jgi:hypothetical protein
MLTAALRVPVAVGVKVTLMLQLLYGDRDEGQLLVWPKSLLFVPVIWIDVMVSGRLPLLDAHGLVSEAETCGRECYERLSGHLVHHAAAMVIA